MTPFSAFDLDDDELPGFERRSGERPYSPTIAADCASLLEAVRSRSVLLVKATWLLDRAGWRWLEVEDLVEAGTSSRRGGYQKKEKQYLQRLPPQPLPSRLALEHEHRHAILTADELVGLHERHAATLSAISAAGHDAHALEGSAIVVVSACWVRPDAPDPDCHTLALVAAQLATDYSRLRSVGLVELGVMIDYCAYDVLRDPELPEPKGAAEAGAAGVSAPAEPQQSLRKGSVEAEAEEAARHRTWERALEAAPLWLTHRLTTVYVVVAEAPGLVRADEDGLVATVPVSRDELGRVLFEEALAFLTPKGKVCSGFGPSVGRHAWLERHLGAANEQHAAGEAIVPITKLVEMATATGTRGCGGATSPRAVLRERYPYQPPPPPPGARFGGGDDEDTEPTTARAWRRLSFLGGEAKPSPPLAPSTFTEQLQRRRVDLPDEHRTLVSVYTRACRRLLRERAALVLGGSPGWGDEEVRELAKALREVAKGLPEPALEPASVGGAKVGGGGVGGGGSHNGCGGGTNDDGSDVGGAIETGTIVSGLARGGLLGMSVTQAGANGGALVCSLLDLSCTPRLTHMGLSCLVRTGTMSPLLPNLTHLDLHGCPRLTSLPEWVARLGRLESLRLGQCTALMALPATLGRPGSPIALSLKLLDLHGCSRLASLPHGLVGLEQLTTLDLAGCTALDWALDTALDWASEMPDGTPGAMRHWALNLPSLRALVHPTGAVSSLSRPVCTLWGESCVEFPD